MRNRLLVLPALAGGLIVAASAVTAAAAPPFRDTARPGAQVAAAPARAGARTVVLINGDRVMAAAAGRPNVAVLPAAAGPGGSVLALGAGGVSYAIPAAAVPFVGRGLDASLFNVGDLLREERGGRVPVWVAYRERRPALPGVTFTRAGHGVAAGYLTASSARVFGAALVRQSAADHPRGSYGRDGMFAGVVSVSLAGTAPARGGQAVSLVPQARRRSVAHTLTITGTDLAGGPDNGDSVMVASVDNSNRFAEFGTFHHGTVTMRIPDGHYWINGTFANVTRVVVVPQFTVSKDTTVAVDERAATSKITVTTPRPSLPTDTNVNVLRLGAAGPNSYADITTSNHPRVPLYFSPTTRRPTVGTLQVLTSWIRVSPPSVPGIPYRYYLERLDTTGLIQRTQHYVVRPDTLATVHARFYSDIPGTGFNFVIGVPSAVANEYMGFDVTGNPVRLPGRQAQYFTAGSPPVVWEQWEQSGNSADGQLGPYREFQPGEVTENWGAFPLHPAPNVNPAGAIAGSNDLAPSLVSASRSGNALTLDLWPFSDSTGDTGTRFTGANDPGARVSGTYEIDQNGTKIASGNAVGSGVSFGDFYTTATLGTKPSVIRLTLNASVTGAQYPLSTATHTVWAWPSAREPRATVPRGWACRWVSTAPHLRGRNCAVQPMMTLSYHVARLSLDGSAKAGPQSLAITAGHLPLATPAKITAVRAQVSFDDGKTWHPATITGSSGAYHAAFTAAAGSYVTLRVTATDAVGGSISETITRAYKIAS